MVTTNQTIPGSKMSFDDAASVTREKARTAAYEAQEALRHGAEAVKRKTREVAESASNTLRDQATQLRDSAQRAYDSSASAVKSGFETGRRKVTASTEVCRREIARHPLSTVTGAVAVGLLVGLVIGRMRAARAI